MQGKQTLQHRIIAYVMAVLLVLNLCSGITGATYVQAVEPASSVTVTTGGNSIDNTVIFGDSVDLAYNFDSAYTNPDYTYWYRINDDEAASLSGASGTVNVSNPNSSTENTSFTVTFWAKNSGSAIVDNSETQVKFKLGKVKPTCETVLNPAAAQGKPSASKESIQVAYRADKWAEGQTYKAYRKITKSDDTVVKTESEITLSASSDVFKQECLETFTVQEYGEGAYTVTYYLKNASDTTDVISAGEVTFLLDKTSPTIETSISGASAEEEVDYTVKVTDANFASCDITEYIKQKTLNGEDSRNQPLVGLVNGTSKTLEFTEEGIYEVYVSAVDAAGNATTSETKEFIIDRSKPVLSITNADNSGAGSGLSYNTSGHSLKLELEAEDLKFSDDARDIKVTVKKDSETPEEKAVTWSTSGYKKNAELVFDGSTEDGNYEVVLLVKDRLGHSEEKTYSFIVDKSAPSIESAKVTYVDTDKGTPNKVTNGTDITYYLKDDARVSFQVNERNRTGAEVSVTTMKNGTERKEPYNPIPLDDSEGDTTFSYTYTEEGNYVTTIQAKDAANNQTTPPVVKKFVIDKTAPVFSIQRMVNGTPVEVGDNTAFSGTEGQTLRFTVADDNHDISSYVVEVTKKTENSATDITTTLGAGDIQWTAVSDSNQIYLTNRDLFTEEGQYTVTITGKDLAGNEPAEVTKVRFRIDNTKPVITQTSALRNNEYYNQSVVFQYKIKEFNFNDTDASIEVTRKIDGRVIPEITGDAGKLVLNGLESGFQYNCNEPGAYTIKIQAKDKAGNEAAPYIISFVVDKSAPKLSISGVENKYMTKEPVTLVFQAKDQNHDFDEYKIHITRSNVDEEIESYDIVGQNPSEHDVDGSGWVVEGYNSGQQQMFITKRTLRFEEEGIYHITFNAVDLAGNEAVEKTISFSIDHTAPQITGIRYSDVNGLIREKYSNIYSNKAIKVEFSVKDMVVGVNDQRVYVTVGTADGRTTDTPVYIAHKSAGNRYYVYIPTDLNVNEFDSPITIWANDLLANESDTVSAKVIYNTLIPAISMNCDTDYFKWTNQDVTFHTNVKDEKSGLKEVTYKVNDKVVKKVVFDKLTTSYDYDVTAKESASKVTGYAVTVEVTNNCGTTNKIQRQVYIDKVKPKVTLSGVQQGYHYKTNQTFQTDVHDVSYKNTKTVYVITRELDGKTSTMSAAVFSSKKYDDSCSRKMIKEGRYRIYAITTDSAGNRTKSNTITFVIDKTAPKLSISGTSDGSMNGTPVTIDFSCVESFYATNQISIQVEKTLDGKTTTEDVNGFPRNAKKTKMSHTFPEDGTYKVTFSATDKAGNVARSQTIHFSVDRTKPDIRISGTDNYQQWNKPATLQFTVEESFYSGNDVTITGTHTDIDGNVTEVEVPKLAGSGKISSLSQYFDEDGIYFFEIVSRDQAGNRESREIHFTIDQTSPQINKVGNYQGGYYQEFQLSDSLEDVFKDLTVISYRILLNGVEYNGTDKITEEGKYNLYVKVEDELGHQSQENVEFIIDHSKPKVIFSGVKNGENVHESGTVTMALTNTEDEITNVRMNGVDYGADTRMLAYTEYGVYQIEVDCKDKAGNTVTQTLHFAYSNPVTIALLLGSMGMLVLATCIWLWIRTRKKEKEENKL